MNRAPIEKWSRAELEDKYHSVAGQVNVLKNANNKIERELKV